MASTTLAQQLEVPNSLINATGRLKTSTSLLKNELRQAGNRVGGHARRDGDKYDTAQVLSVAMQDHLETVFKHIDER